MHPLSTVVHFISSCCIDCLTQACSKSSAIAIELFQSCTKPTISYTLNTRIQRQQTSIAYFAIVANPVEESWFVMFVPTPNNFFDIRCMTKCWYVYVQVFSSTKYCIRYIIVCNHGDISRQLKSKTDEPPPPMGWFVIVSLLVSHICWKVRHALNNYDDINVTHISCPFKTANCPWASQVGYDWRFSTTYKYQSMVY